MNANNIKNFHAVVELQSLVAAAEYLHISQPALSKSIKNLEEDVGCALFTHAKNKMKLNDNGYKYYSFTKNFFSRYQKLVEELRESNGLNSPNLCISFSSAGNIIPILIHGFKQEHPESNFMLRTEIKNVIDTTSHFTFMASHEEIKQPNYYLLLREPLYLTISSDNALAQEKSIRLAEQAEQTFLSPTRTNDMFDIQMHYCKLAGFSPQLTNIIEKNNVLLSLISLNMGVTLMPQLTYTAFADRRIVQLPISDISCYRYIYLLENENVYQTQLAQAFKQFCLKHKY